ncbi:MAG: His/Gly/Thr/Pro-type tRNA ligase C-terminal domain-containing protein [Sarcina sp.]
MDSLKKKLSYVNKIGAENVILIGEEEVRKGEIKIKNMRTGGEIIKNLELEI